MLHRALQGWGRAGLVPVGLLIVGLLACGDEASEPVPDETPVQPAGTDRRAPIPPDLRIEVEIDGRPAPPIDAVLLERLQQREARGVGRRVWSLRDLLGGVYERPGTTLEVESKAGVRTLFEEPAQGIAGREPKLILNRRGELIVALLRSERGSAAFHGRGGTRGRGQLARGPVRHVTALRLYRTPPGPARRPALSSGKAAKTVLAVYVDGKRAATWSTVDLARVQAQSDNKGRGSRKQAGSQRKVGEGGERRGPRGAGQSWSLRDVVGELLGPDRVVERLMGDDSRVLDLAAADWEDPQKVPVLRLNRRGQFKFEWRTAAGARLRGDWLRGVQEVHVRERDR